MKIEITPTEAEDYLAWLGSNKLTNLIYVANYFVLFATLAVILLSVIVAFMAWRASSRHNADEHMHHLFMELLKIRLTHRPDKQRVLEASLKAQDPKLVDVDNHVYDIAGMKLYVLEEMYSWLTTQRQIQLTFGRFYSLKTKKIIDDNLEAWNRTIITHALDDFEGTRSSIEDFASCYSIAFMDYIARGTGCSELSKLVAIHLERVEAGEKRPLGRREKALADKVVGRNSGTVDAD